MNFIALVWITKSDPISYVQEKVVSELLALDQYDAGIPWEKEAGVHVAQRKTEKKKETAPHVSLLCDIDSRRIFSLSFFFSHHPLPKTSGRTLR